MAAWKVNAVEACASWEDAFSPDDETYVLVMAWFVALTRYGPTDEDTFQSPLDEDAFTAAIRKARVFVDYQAFGHPEYLVRVKAIEPFYDD